MTARIATATMACFATLLLGACAKGEADQRDVIRAPQAQVVGEPVSCVSLDRIERTQVHDDYTIDFHMRNNTIYRNTLPARCASLGFEQRFAYQVSTGQLCRTDTIRVITGSGIDGVICGLGPFVPIELTAEPR